MPTPLACKPSFGLPLTTVLDEELPCDFEVEYLEMVNKGGSRDQPPSLSLRIPKFLLPHTQASQGSSTITWQFGNDLGASPRDLLHDKLDGSPSEFAFSADAYETSNEAQGAHFAGQFKKTATVTSAANESDETQGDAKKGRHVPRRGFASAAADAISGASASEKKKTGASASAEAISQRGDHAENGALSDLPLAKATLHRFLKQENFLSCGQITLLR
eukprot:TRINITY_DN12382_c0_g1_i1.p1 TRINITY_DN12382_c0_g1~~TRINITY_DN12382_c0_g1_i1.p1  ORF type:complete len:218 (-),score=35.30 TRINITY_DN12382_c0_g1_i1:91-744(-)